MTMEPEQWTLRRSRLSHDAIRNRLNLRLRALKQVVPGRVEMAELLCEFIADTESLGAEILGELEQIVSDLPVAMSPRQVVAVSWPNEANQREIALEITESAHLLWIRTCRIEELINCVRAEAARLIRELTQLRKTGLDADASPSLLLDRVDACQEAADMLSTVLSKLPNRPGLCFPSRRATPGEV